MRGQEQVVGSNRREHVDVKHHLIALGPRGMHRARWYPQGGAGPGFDLFAVDLEDQRALEDEAQLIERMVMRLDAGRAGPKPVERDDRAVAADGGSLEPA